MKLEGFLPVKSIEDEGDILLIEGRPNWFLNGAVAPSIVAFVIEVKGLYDSVLSELFLGRTVKITLETIE